MPNKRNTLLVVDSEPQTFRILDLVLNAEAFEVVASVTGKQAVRQCASLKPDLVLLDLDMPDMTSAEIIQAIRGWSQVPIIIVSARKTDADVIENLNLGADDYVTKPFNADVLLARINASLRKSAVHESGESELTNGPLRIDLVRHKVYMGDELMAFTPKEYALLRYFLIHCGKMLTHKDILREVWGPAHSNDTQYLRVFIGQIREKIEKHPANPMIITTELGIGYRMEFIRPAPVIVRAVC